MAFYRKQISELMARLDRIESRMEANAPSPGSLLVSAAAESQAETLKAMGGFIKMVSDIALERSAAALGRKGGKSRTRNAPRDAKGRLLPNRARPSCRLCANPLVADFSVNEWQAHQDHKQGQPYPEQRPDPEPQQAQPQPDPGTEVQGWPYLGDLRNEQPENQSRSESGN